jgi:hypothetical protein
MKTGDGHESNGFSEKNLPEMQDRPAQGRGAGDLFQCPPQTTPRLSNALLKLI